MKKNFVALFMLSSVSLMGSHFRPDRYENNNNHSFKDDLKIVGMLALSPIIIPAGLCYLVYADHKIAALKQNLIKDTMQGKVNLDLLKSYVEGSSSAELQNFKTRSGKNLLHMAVHGGQLDVVQYLLPKFDPNALTGKLETPLHVAAEKGHLPVVTFLATYNNVRALDSENENPWQKAQKHNKIEALHFITQYQVNKLQQENDPTCFMCMEADSHVDRFSLCDYRCLTPICVTCKDDLTRHNKSCPNCRNQLCANL